MISKIRRNFTVRRQRVFVLTDVNNIVSVCARVPVAISRVAFDNVDGVTDFRSERYARIFRKQLKEGQYAVYARRESKVVGHAWAKACEERSCRVNGYMDISRGEALIHFCNVREDQRGNGIYSHMLVALCKILFSEGKVTRVLIDTEVDNKASLRGITKVGFRPLGTGFYLQVRGRLCFKRFTSPPNRLQRARKNKARKHRVR